MATEIERKFLVVSDQWRAAASGPGLDIRQGYLSRPPAGGGRGGPKGGGGAPTIKGGRGPGRSEHEWPIGFDEANELLERALPSVLTKTRHLVPFAGLTWEVDEFHGAHAGLVVAEVELDEPDQSVERPPWVGQEVTGDERYAN